MALPLLVAAVIVLLYLLNSIKILKEYERAVVFRLGRVRHDATGPGVILVFRPFEQIVRVSSARRPWKSRRRTSSPATTSP